MSTFSTNAGVCGLGWKTKWTSEDFRHEWNPVLSFVFFGYQIALTFYSPYHSHYWEPWLYYEYATDKTKSKRERIEQCRKEAPQTWTSSKYGEEPVTTDYYTKILKSKYLKANSDRQILSFDADDVGVQNSKQITEMFDFDYTNVPRKYLAEGIKDWADLAKVHGMKAIEDYLKEKQLI